jgi:uncharacterized protein YuzB (UPF0349 family)
MYGKSLIPKKLLEKFCAHFNIIDLIHFNQFDENLNILRKFFLSTRKEYYDINDRYIIIHQDTDLYIPHCSVGINLQNFFAIVKEIDIPLSTLLFYTNHFGITQEIDRLCQYNHEKDRPTVIESFVTSTHMAKNYIEKDINIDQINYHALCMMGANRSHRFALYNKLKHIDTNTLAMTIQGLKQ